MDFLQPYIQYAITPSRKSKPKVQEFIYSDELNKNQAPVKVKKKVHFESRDESKKKSEIGKKNEKDGISRGVVVDREKSGIQVKILMTKEEAARLLSQCKDGGILEFNDVASELVKLPNNRVHVVSSTKKH